MANAINQNNGTSELTLRQQDASAARLVAVAAPASCTQTVLRILRLPEVITRVGLRRASIYQHMAAGSFPKPISLGARAVGWLDHEIDAWLAARIAARPTVKGNDV